MIQYWSSIRVYSTLWVHWWSRQANKILSHNSLRPTFKLFRWFTTTATGAVASPSAGAVPRMPSKFFKKFNLSSNQGRSPICKCCKSWQSHILGLQLKDMKALVGSFRYSKNSLLSWMKCLYCLGISSMQHITTWANVSLHLILESCRTNVGKY